MQAAWAMRSSGSEPAQDSPVSIAISASPELHSRIERLARRAGARLVGRGATFNVLLLAVDASTPLPTSDATLSLLVPGVADLCVLWYGMAPPVQVVTQMLRAGVQGILPIDIEPEKFQAALNAIRAGLDVVDPRFLHEAHKRNIDSVEDLTDREQEVFAMMGKGLANKEIASALAISTHTVKFHISSILGKMGAASRTEAVSLGIKSGKLAI